MVPVLRLIIFTMNVVIVTWDHVPESNKKQMPGKEYKPWTVMKQYFFRILSNLQQFAAQGLPKTIMVDIYAVYISSGFLSISLSSLCLHLCKLYIFPIFYSKEFHTYTLYEELPLLVSSECANYWLFMYWRRKKQVIQPFLSGARTFLYLVMHIY